MPVNEKIQAIHLDRRATVYLRQSTLKQVCEHRESTARQYALKDRAIALGWSAVGVKAVSRRNLGMIVGLPTVAPAGAPRPGRCAPLGSPGFLHAARLATANAAGDPSGGPSSKKTAAG